MVWCLRGFCNCPKHILTTYNFFGHSFCKPCHVWSNILGFTAIKKIRELSGNLKNSLIFTKNQGVVREFGTASGIFHCNQGFSIAIREFSEMNLLRLCLSMTHGIVLQILAGYSSHSPWISLGNGCLLNHWVCGSSWISLYLVEIRIMLKIFPPFWMECEKILRARNFCLVRFQNVI